MPEEELVEEEEPQATMTITKSHWRRIKFGTATLVGIIVILLGVVIILGVYSSYVEPVPEANTLKAVHAYGYFSDFPEEGAVRLIHEQAEDTLGQDYLYFDNALANVTVFLTFHYYFKGSISVGFKEPAAGYLFYPELTGNYSLTVYYDAAFIVIPAVAYGFLVIIHYKS